MARAVRYLLVAVVAAMVVMWVYVFFADPQPSPDRLEDRSFPAAAQQRCASTRRAIERLPRAADAPSPQARADVVDQANELLHTMVKDLRAGAPSGGDDGRIVRAWLADWDTYIGDRAAWAADTRAGEDVRFFETSKGGGPISELIDQFATINDMPSCATTDDL